MKSTPSGTESDNSTARRPRRRHGENRERLIEAGMSEFGMRGYHGASTAAIARLADVPQPHVYANFETKHELFIVCLERACELLETRSRSGSSDSLHSAQANQLMLASRVLLQAVVNVNNETSDEVTKMINHTRSTLGEELFTAALGEAAVNLF